MDGDLNTRSMTIGDKDAHLVQSIVHCKGAAADSCFEKNKPGLLELRANNGSAPESCDLSPERCPCEFEMSRMPAMYFEYQSMAEHLADVDDAGGGKVFMIGLGGGLLPQYVLSQTMNLNLEVAEINPDVVSAARAFFGVAGAERDGRLAVETGDGLAALGARRPGSYRAVVVDCCDGDHVPEPCRSPALISTIRDALKPGGVVVQNVPIGGGHTSDLDAAVGQYRLVFGEKAVSVEPKGGNAVIFVDTDKS